MKITNNYGLPGAIVEAVKNDSYTMGKMADISVTGLLSPPRQKALMREHYAEIEEDASDRIWALIGQATHAILERAEPSAIVEERLYIYTQGWTISGQFDRMTLRQKTLQDYKMMSVWEVIYGLKKEKEEQLNVLMQLAVENGYTDITNLEIVGIFRDWSKTKAKFDKNYPQSQVARIKVNVWPETQRIAFINERVRVHQAARETLPLPECTTEERWATPDKWALMKVGRKSAVKLYDSEDEALTAAGSDLNLSVVHRPGEQKRCENYCAVAQFCDQYKRLCGNEK